MRPVFPEQLARAPKNVRISSDRFKKRLGFFLATALVMMAGSVARAATFTSAATGNWNASATWTLSTGTDADGIPDADDDVTIQATHTVTIANGATEACLNLTIAGTSGTRIVIGTSAAATLEVYGGLNNSNVSPGANAIDCRNAAGSKLAFRTTANGALFSGSGSFGNMTAVKYEMNLANGVTGTSSGTIKAASFTVTNGTWSHTSGDIRPDAGTTDTGTLTINGGTLDLGSGSIGRTSTTRCASVTVGANGTLRIGGIASTLNAATVTFTGLVEYYASGNQTFLTSSTGTQPNTYLSLKLSGSGTKTGPASGTIVLTNGTIEMSGGATPPTFAIGAGGSYSPAANVLYTATGAQTTGIEWSDPTNVTINNSAGVTLSESESISGVLTLTSGDLNTGAFTLTMPNTASSTGTTDVIGNVTRTGFVSGGAALSFGNPFNTIKIDSGTVPTDINVNLVKTAPANFTTAVTRTYTITPNGGSGYSATLQLHYLEAELNGNNESFLKLWREDNSVWTNQGALNLDLTNNWVRQTGVTQFSPWTIAAGNTPTAANGTISGYIVSNTGAPVEGAVVNVNGTQNRKSITNAKGYYEFHNVETTGFYTVTPTRANYGFTPGSRSFSQLGNNTEAVFTATPASGFVNPLDTPEYFVRQHYLDFLGREPDEAGFNFWSDQILACGADAGCLERRTINVSAAYFLSIEFQRTGGMVDRLYRASYGRDARYAEFIPDRALIAHDVRVGRDGWEAQLAATEDTFVDNWVARPAFKTAFDGLSNAEYVDRLIGNTGVGFTQTERDAFVSSLNGAASRADVLQQIAANDGFAKARFNEAFVLMEYFGYLRRDPDESGYQFWLTKLNQFDGNFERAEMVKAFINSIEYRARFVR